MPTICFGIALFFGTSLQSLRSELIAAQRQDSLALISVHNHVVSWLDFSSAWSFELDRMPDSIKLLSAYVYHVSWDNQTIIGSTADHGLFLYDLRTKRTSWTHEIAPTAVALSHKGDRIALVLPPGLFIHDVKTGKRQRIATNIASASQVDWSVDDERILYTSEAGKISTVAPNTGQSREYILGDNATWYPDGGKIVYQSEGTFHCFDPATLQSRILIQGRVLNEPLRFSPDGKYASFLRPNFNILFGEQADLIVYRVKDGAITRVDYGSYGTKLAVFWGKVDAKRQQERARSSTKHSHKKVISNRSLAVSHDGKKLVVGSPMGTAIVYDIPTNQRVQTLGVPEDMVISIAINRDGSKVLTGTLDSKAILWDTRRGKPLKTFLGHKGAITSVAMSQDAAVLLTGSTDKTAILWNAQTSEKIFTFVGHAVPIENVTLSADGKRAMTVSGDRACLWDCANGQKLHMFPGANAFLSVSRAAMDRTGQNVVTSFVDQAITLWNGNTGKQQRRFTTGFGPLTSLALNADSTRIITGSYQQADLWDAKSGRLLLTIPVPQSLVVGVAFSPDGDYVYTATESGEVIQWDSVSGMKHRVFW